MLLLDRITALEIKLLNTFHQLQAKSTEKTNTKKNIYLFRQRQETQQVTTWEYLSSFVQYAIKKESIKVNL